MDIIRIMSREEMSKPGLGQKGFRQIKIRTGAILTRPDFCVASSWAYSVLDAYYLGRANATRLAFSPR